MKKDAQYLLTEKKFIDVLGETLENIYIPNPQIRLEYQDLYDAYITDEIPFSEIEEKDLGFFISEYPYFSKHLNIVSNKNNKIFFNAQFLSTFEAGCKGSISVLGRYFSSSHRYVSWNEKPRNSLAAEIYNSKKIEDFLLWNNELVDALETFLRFFVKDLLSKGAEKIYITSIPNKNGKNRFKNLLNKLNTSRKTNYENTILFIDDFFIPNKKVETRGYGYKSKKNYLQNLYKINKNHLPLGSTQIIIIDDVLTSGAHLEECLRALRETGEEGINKYKVHGVFLSATQRHEFIDSTKIAFTLPKIIKIT